MFTSYEPEPRHTNQLSPFMLRKTYNSYCNAVDTEASRLNVNLNPDQAV